MRSSRRWWSKLDTEATDVRAVADPEIDALSHEARAELAGIWQERGASELKVAGGFTAVTALMIEHGTADGALKLLSRAVRDEVRHAEIAVDMAARYRASEVEWPPPQPFPVPLLAPAEGRLRATLLVIAMCCVNETLACAILEGQLSQATSPLTRAALQSVLADEIDHARAGWAHLATPFVTTPMKDEIGASWLPRILNARLRDLVESDAPFPGERFPTHGILTRAARKQIVAEALAAVVFPGFTRAGIDSTKAQEWAQKAFPLASS
jgi:hypothetical protein